MTVKEFRQFLGRFPHDALIRCGEYELEIDVRCDRKIVVDTCGEVGFWQQDEKGVWCSVKAFSDE